MHAQPKDRRFYRYEIASSKRSLNLKRKIAQFYPTLPRQGASVAAASTYSDYLEICGLSTEIIFYAGECRRRNKHSTMMLCITTQSAEIDHVSAPAEISCFVLIDQGWGLPGRLCQLLVPTAV
jgi:hypothetical protein